MQIPGIHHVTAIAGNPQRNIDFYTRVLGLRLLKVTVNFDDPSSYHFYYGDWSGTPGTILTFFAWPNGHRGRHGIGQIGEIAFAVPRSSLAFWMQHLVQQNVQYSGPTQRFGEQFLSLRDPDGILLEVVATAEAESIRGWEGGTVPAEHTIRCIQSVTLWEEELGPTDQLLTQTMGFRKHDSAENTTRYATGDGGPGAYLQVRNVQGFWRGAGGVGTVHHVAWRAADDAQELAWRDELIAAGANVTPQRDRQYFRSIYYREPGGVLFEIATDVPGFAIDEPIEALGKQLQLPPWLEPRRTEIEQSLPPISL
jgi:glyoxalase family protein